MYSINTRDIVLEMLIKVLEEGQLSHYAHAEVLAGYTDLGKQDRSFIKRLFQGTLERRLFLDYLIESCSSVKLKKMKPVIRNILRLSVYQLVCMDQVPESAVCNEAVKLAKKHGYSGLSGFVNGVLRGFIRNSEKLCSLEGITDQCKRMSLKYSMPEWIIKNWSSIYSTESIEKTLIYFIQANATGIRCNESRIKADELAAMLNEHDCEVKSGRYLPGCMNITGYDTLDGLEEFRKGFFCVQDESSALIEKAAGLRKDMQVLDICAAPGGKSMAAADRLRVLGGGRVTACDLNVQKTDLIRENIKRCCFSNISIVENDALIFNEKYKEAFDLLLADLPCSGLGIIGKKPDIKYNMTEERLIELAQLQRDIMNVAVQYVKKGGSIVYSTCTIDRKENEDNVVYFCSKHGLETEDLDEFLPKELHNEQTKHGILQLIPGIHGTDGFFMARLKKL